MAKMLLAEPNVELFDFQAHFDWIENYDLYYDLIHYISTVNDEIAYKIAEDFCHVRDIDEIHQNNQILLERVHSLFPH